MPYCQHCGTKVEYCPSCGQPLDASVRIEPGSADVVSRVLEQAGHEPYQERVLWEGKPGAKAGSRALTMTYRITSERVQVIHTGLRKNTEEIELTRLKDVKVDQSLTQRALKTGNVTIISTDSTTPTIIFQEIHDPEVVKELVRKAARDEIDRLGVQRFTPR